MTESRSADVRFFTGTVVISLATTLALIFVFLWPELRDWLIAQTVVPVPVVAACPTPQDSAEQMHIVVRRRGGTLTAECMFVGSTGTYYRGRR